MKPVSRQSWERFQKYYSEYPTIGLAVDLSRLNFPDDYFASLEEPMQKAFAAMADLERGDVRDSSEEQMVSRYWMRNPALAPTPALRGRIESTVQAIKDFAEKVHRGFIAGADGPFENLLIIGHGRATLGAEFLTEALSNPTADGLVPFFFDTTDPDGMERVLDQIGDSLGKTLCIVISIEDEQEALNAVTIVRAAYGAAALQFGPHAVVITRVASKLDNFAATDGWLARFPGEEWLGELLLVALQEFGIDELLRGGKYCDELTRVNDVKANPAAQLFLIFYSSYNDKDNKKVAFLPYKDRLSLFFRYFQCVAGNLFEDESDNSLVIFIHGLKDQAGSPFFVEERVTAGDFLHASWLAKRDVGDRESLSLTLQSISPFEVGVLMALFERALGFYRLYFNVNISTPPELRNTEKVIANLDLQMRVLAYLNGHGPSTVAEIGRLIDSRELETIFWICEHLAANPARRIEKQPGANPFQVSYGLSNIS